MERYDDLSYRHVRSLRLWMEFPGALHRWESQAEREWREWQQHEATRTPGLVARFGAALVRWGEQLQAWGTPSLPSARWVGAASPQTRRRYPDDGTCTMQREPVARRREARSLWRHRDFRLFWAGETVSLVGSQMTLLALPLLAALSLGASAGEMGLLRAAEYLPFLLLTPFAGVWVDRARRRPFLLVANVGRAVLLLMVPLCATLGWLSFGVLVATVVAVGVLTVFFELAYQSFLPAVVPPEQLVEGNSKLFSSAAIAEVGGPGLGGWLIGAITAPVVLVVDALSFLVSATALAALRGHEPEPSPRPTPDLWAELREGFRAVFAHPLLRAFLGEATTFNFFWNGLHGVFVLYAVRVLRFDPGTLGVVFAAGSVGGLLGAVTTTHAARWWGRGRVIVLAAALSCLALLGLPLAAAPGVATAAWLAAVLFLNSFGVAACNVHTFTVRQESVPDHLRGRTNAAYRTVSWGAIPLGAALGGAFAEVVGLRPALVVGVIGLATAWLWFARPALWRLREPVAAS